MTQGDDTRRLRRQRRGEGSVPARRLRAPARRAVGERGGRDRGGLRPLPPRRDRRRRQGLQRHDDGRARHRSVRLRHRQRDGATALLPRVAGQRVRAAGHEHRPAAVRRGHGHRLRPAARQAARPRRRRVRLAPGPGVLDRHRRSAHGDVLARRRRLDGRERVHAVPAGQPPPAGAAAPSPARRPRHEPHARHRAASRRRDGSRADRPRRHHRAQRGRAARFRRQHDDRLVAARLHRRLPFGQHRRGRAGARLHALAQRRRRGARTRRRPDRDRWSGR